MSYLSKNNRKTKKRSAVFDPLCIFINLLIIVLGYLLLDYSLNQEITNIILLFINVILIILLDRIVLYKCIKKQNKYRKTLLFMDKLIKNKHGKDVTETLKTVFNETYNYELKENNIDGVLKEIKININDEYLNIFLDAYMNTFTNVILKRIRNQIKSFIKEEEMESTIANLLDVKRYLALSLFVFIIMITSTSIIRYQTGFINIYLLISFITYYSIYIFYFCNYAKNKEDEFFKWFYLNSIYMLPFVAYDKSLLNNPKLNNKYLKIKQAFLEDKNFKDVLKIKIKHYLLIKKIMQNNELVKEEFNLKNKHKKLLNYPLKTATTIYFALPIFFFIIMRFYI